MSATGSLRDSISWKKPEDCKGLWRLLLPADEIEKAFREGFGAMANALEHGGTISSLWLSSRAYKIAKGITE